MQLQGRQLSIDMHGEDVNLLHQELKQLGFDTNENERADSFFGPSTESAVLTFQRQYHLEPTGIVDERTAVLINQMVEENQPQASFVVKGRVMHADGKPFTGGLMRAYDKDLRSEELLGEVQIDNDGGYEITYSPEQFGRAEKATADLRISACTRDGSEVASSPILFNAGAEETVDLVIGGEAYRGPSEYEQLVDELTPLLQELSLAELTEDEEHQDITFLSGETGRDPLHIDLLIKAHGLMQTTEVQAEVFYGFFREDLPTALPALLAQSPDVQRQGLLRAASNNIIPPRFGEQADTILDQLKRLIVKQAFEPQAEVGRATLPELLGTIIPDRQQQERFLSAYVAHTGPVEEFWRDLEAQPEFQDRIKDLQWTLQLGAFTGNHPPLVQALQRMKAAGEIDAISDLARFDETQWCEIIGQGKNGPIGFPQNVRGENDEEKTRNYARAMAQMAEDAFPTAFITHRRAGEQRDRKDAFWTFFQANQTFSIKETRLENYLADNPGALNGIAEGERETLKSQVKAFQRIYKVAPRYSQTSALLKDGLDSSYSISRMGKTTFAIKYGDALGGQAQAKIIYDRARQSTSMAMILLSDYGMPSLKTPMRVLSDAKPKQDSELPDWPTLFGSLDLCECAHCRSVYGPAAYLVDILHFLKDRRLVDTITRDAQGNITHISYKQKTLTDGGTKDKSTADVLFERRFDLMEIELTCENTNTPVPYVDLVNEVLEDFIAPFEAFTPFSLDATREKDLNSRTFSSDLRNAFDPPLSQQATIGVKGKGTWWTIDDLSFSYTIHKESGQIQVTTRGRQTSGSAEALAANPQYINPQAYDKLAQQVFPWQLPFDLWAEEARVYLDHLGVERHTIMETFLPGDRTAVLDSIDVTREHLVLTSTEANLINGSTTSQPGANAPGAWNLWGFAAATLSAANPIPDPSGSTKWITSGGWVTVLKGRVDVFLQQSGLKYKDLLDLLTTHAINPLTKTGERTITIQSTVAEVQDTCELASLTLAGLDQAAATKIPRFVRLWRKLGWHLFDLDRAVSALTPGNLNDPFLKQLSHVKRLHGRLKVPVERLLVFWAPIDTTVYIDHHANNQPTVPSLYTRLFRNKTVINPPDPAFTEDASGLTGPLSTHQGAIASALGISAQDLSRLISDAQVFPRDPADPTRPDDRLTLDSLSCLIRNATLAKALKLKIPDYLSMVSLYGSDPFAGPKDTVLFTEHVDQMRSSGFSVAELDYLLRHTPAAVTETAPTDTAIGLVLGDIRAGLQTIAAENTFREDPADPNGPTIDLNGDLTRTKLALLNWDGSLIDQVVASLNEAVTYRTSLAALPAGLVLPNDTGSYEAPLAALPANFLFPNAVKEIMTYDSVAHKLKASRLLTQPERTILLTVSNAQSYLDALQKLFLQQDELQGKISYDDKAQELCFSGVMTLARQTRLKSILVNDNTCQNAVDKLFDAPRRFVRRNFAAFSVPDFSAPLADLPAKVAFPAALKDRVYFDAKAGMLNIQGAMSEAMRDLLLNLSTDTTDPNHTAYQTAVGSLFKAPDTLAPQPDDVFLTTAGPGNDVDALFNMPTTPADRFKLVLKKLLPHLRTMLNRRLVTQKISEALQLETESTGNLLTEWIRWPAQAGKNALDAFLADAFAKSNPNLSATRSHFGDLFDTYTLLHKIAVIISVLELTSKQLGWLFAYSPIVGWPDLNQLPLTATDPGNTVLATWERLWRLCRLRDKLPRGEAFLEKLLTLAYGISAGASIGEKNMAKKDFITLLSTVMGWTKDDLETLVGDKQDHTATGLLKAAFPADFRDERLLGRLLDCFGLLKRLGMSAEQCGNASKADIGDSAARDIRQAVRAKYDDAQWLKLAKPLHDGLREKQRAAMVAFLVAHPDTTHPWRDTNDVYAHFLIDVEMSPCQMTSRIKQAISSVQLFVQRCLMHLEPEVLAGAEVDDRWREWKWMKNYRVWEANRKVFLYPENWIEPELRDDKTPFFKALESELLQSDLTKETAEDAFLAYLEKLDQVARLEIVGICHQVEHDLAGQTAMDILHVFGRTSGIPHIYFYRQRVDGDYWTAWEKVDLDIEGDHLIPVVWNRRLYLFWPIFTEKARPLEVSLTDGELSGTAPVKYWEIKLAWSERKQDKWTNKKISSAHEVIEQDYTDDLSQFFFRWSVDSCNNFTILVLTDQELQNKKYRYGAFRFDGCHAEPKGMYLHWPNPERPIEGTDFSQMYFKEKSESALYLPVPTDRIALKKKTPGNFLLLPHPDGASITEHPFFYQDDTRTFFVVPSDANTAQPDWNYKDKIDPGKIDMLKCYYEIPLVPNIIGSIINPGDPLPFEPSFPVGPQPRPAIPENEGSILAGEAGAASPATEAAAGVGPAIMADTYAGLPAPFLGVGIPFGAGNQYLFQTFYHPYVCAFVRELNRHGVDGLLQRTVQLYPHLFLPWPPSGSAPQRFDFKKTYDPTEIIVNAEHYPQEDVDFTYSGGYALYNWELFFHTPLMIANRLSQNQRFEEAQKWFHYIFDPTDTSELAVPERYWRTKPFFEKTSKEYETERIPNLLRFLANRGDKSAYAKLTPEQRNDLEALEKQVAMWRKDPFKPHLVARLRTSAYQKTVVMKYIDNLIAWGDQLFRRDTMESINEATQLYVLAAELLGKRPEEIPPRAIPSVQTYKTLEPKLDAFSNALVQIEEFLPPSAGTGIVSSGSEPPLTLPTMLYFCVPNNSKLLGYWDTVADRLFKIRHCMNIEGVVRQLPLFAPPIDPGLLVKAAAAGVDISSALSDINTAMPHYRFHVLAQKATEICGEVKSLGGAMLAALEKRDAEELAVLRAGHEVALLKRVELVRKDQIDETKENVAALRKSRDIAVARYIHYQKLLGVQSPQVPAEGETIAEQPPSPYVSIREEGGVKVVPHEKEELEKLEKSNDKQQSALDIDTTKNVLFMFPAIKMAFWGVGTETSGLHMGFALDALASYYRGQSTDLSYQATRAGKLAAYALRAHEWTLQSNLAAKDIMQIDKQIVAAEIRKAIAERELDNHRRQMEQSEEVESFLGDKFTSRELYSWMVGQISGIYFQAYQLAYDVAKRAERAYRHELGLSDSSFIQFGYWDSLKKGLLAGERLSQDLKRMEVTYLDQHKREYEISKHISLVRLDPLALLQLRQTGECFFSIPEALFDLDYPGHYMRRIKSVGVTIPCVTGPYTAVPCTLTLTGSAVRHANTLSGGNNYGRQDDDPRFTDSVGAIQSIVTSNAQNDSGLFETNLRDERYLPFEGVGAISQWRIELPASLRPFDYDTISDVVLHVRFTAREAGGLLKQQTVVELEDALNAIANAAGEQGLAQFLSVRHEFPDEWNRFLNPPAPAARDQTLTLSLHKDRFPYIFQGRNININKIEFFFKIKSDFSATHNESTLKLSLKKATDASDNKLSVAPWKGLLRAENVSAGSPGDWTLTAWLEPTTDSHQRLNANAIEDIVIVCHYAI